MVIDLKNKLQELYFDLDHEIENLYRNYSLSEWTINHKNMINDIINISENIVSKINEIKSKKIILIGLHKKEAQVFVSDTVSWDLIVQTVGRYEFYCVQGYFEYILSTNNLVKSDKRHLFIQTPKGILFGLCDPFKILFDSIRYKQTA